MSVAERVCGWGILGSAHIARKNWQAIHDSGNSRLIAVASRDIKKSRQFIDDCQRCVPMPKPPEAMGSYEALLARPDIHAVYIPLPTGLRQEWVIRAAEAGKHIIVEKPIAPTLQEAEEMVRVCERNNVQLMDGTMFSHSQRLPKIRTVLQDAELFGKLRRISSHFSFAGSDAFFANDIRSDPKLEPLGCLGDLGWYCVRFSLWAMDFQSPLQVTGRIHSEFKKAGSVEGVPTEFSGELFFADGISASFNCSFVSGLSQWVQLAGTRGQLSLTDFVLPWNGRQLGFSLTQAEMSVDSCRFTMKENRRDFAADEPSNNAPGSQESNLFRTMASLAISGKTDPFWPKIALQTQSILDSCLRSARAGSFPVTVDIQS